MKMRALIIGAVFCLVALSSRAQEEVAPPSDLSGLRSQILTIDSSRLFPETLLGQSIIAALNEERRVFAAEGQALADALRVEELELTDKRATLSREEFSRLAEDFDARVNATRAERDAAEAALNARADAQERAFLGRVRPILGQLMAEAGAAVMIEAETVFLRNEVIDITEIAISRINQATVLDPVGAPPGRTPQADGDAQVEDD